MTVPEQREKACPGNCVGLNVKSPYNAPHFGHLVPGWWHCLGWLWHLEEVELFADRSSSLEVSLEGLRVCPTSCSSSLLPVCGRKEISPLPVLPLLVSVPPPLLLLYLSAMMTASIWNLNWKSTLFLFPRLFLRYCYHSN